MGRSYLLTAVVAFLAGPNNIAFSEAANIKTMSDSERERGRGEDVAEESRKGPYVTADVGWDSLGCDSIMENIRPIHNQSIWMHLRGVYHSIVGWKKSTIAPLSFRNGFSVPVEVKLSLDKGRTVFSADRIRKGDLIWHGLQSARFEDGETYKRFLSSLPNELACDVLMWAYVQAYGDDDEDLNPLIVADLDEGSFLNNGLSPEDSYDDIEEVANVGCVYEAAKALPGGCKENYFALRDIEKGDELLVHYGDFAIPEGWEWFGLL